MGRGLQDSKGGFAFAQQHEEGSPQRSHFPQGWGLLEAARALRPHGPEYQLVVNFATARSFSCFTDEKNEALSS